MNGSGLGNANAVVHTQGVLLLSKFSILPVTPWLHTPKSRKRTNRQIVGTNQRREPANRDRFSPSPKPKQEQFMPTATTTEPTTRQTTTSRTTTQPTNSPTTQLERSAATSLRTTMAAQNVVPVAVTAGDKIEGLRQWASGRCLSADRAGVYSRTEGSSGGRVRRG